MREYELTVVYDLTVAEAGGPEAGPQRITTLVEARGGKMLKVDHWGRRRMAYPINRSIDGDYVVTRVELDPTTVSALEAALGIDERVYRHLVVRADELPIPPAPRAPRQPVGEAAAAAPEAVADAPAVEAPATAVAEEAPVAEASAAAAVEATETVTEAPVVEEAAAPEVVAEVPA